MLVTMTLLLFFSNSFRCIVFVVKNDSPCGSTIGPILASKLGIRTLDIGSPQLSMHSIRETAGSDDIEYSIKLFKEFYKVSPGYPFGLNL